MDFMYNVENHPVVKAVRDGLTAAIPELREEGTGVRLVSDYVPECETFRVTVRWRVGRGIWNLPVHVSREAAEDMVTKPPSDYGKAVMIFAGLPDWKPELTNAGRAFVTMIVAQMVEEFRRPLPETREAEQTRIR